MWRVDEGSPDYDKLDIHYEADLIFYIEMDAPGNNATFSARKQNKIYAACTQNVR